MADEDYQRRYAKLDAVVFDFDGVILDSVDIKTRAFGQLYADYGEEIRNRVEAYHLKHGGVSRYEKFRYYQRELVHGPSDGETIQRLADQFSSLVWDGIINSPFVPGAELTLRSLSPHIPLFLASGTPETELAEIVKVKGLTRLFQGIYGSPQSKLEILSIIVKERNYHPEKCVMVGDSITDFNAAKSAGFLFLGVCCNSQSPFPNQTYVFQDLRDFPIVLSDICLQIN